MSLTEAPARHQPSESESAGPEPQKPTPTKIPAAVLWAPLAAILGGLLLPWATGTALFVGNISVAGLSTDHGKIIGVALLLLAGLTAVETIDGPRIWTNMLLVLGGVGIVFATVIDAVDVSARIAATNATPFGHADVGTGLYLVIVGAVALLMLSIYRTIEGFERRLADRSL